MKNLDRPPANISLSMIAAGGEQKEHVAIFGDKVPAEVWAALANRDRICPTLAGVGWLDGNSMVLRLATGELRLAAPKRLLRRALERCDGQHTLEEILRRTPVNSRDEFAQFIEFLFAQGALVDAIYLTQHMAGYGFQSTSVGKEAPRSLTGRIARRFTEQEEPSDKEPLAGHAVQRPPINSLLEKRVSMHTFDDAGLTEEQLLSLLWSIGGVVSDVHPRWGAALPLRATGSGGGMYLIQWMVALTRAVGRYAPGVYAIQYPAAGRVALKLVSADLSNFQRAFFQPAYLSFAAGAVFAIGDGGAAALRYRNRALQYMFMEAGAALQNFSLTAPALGLAGSIIGGYCEEEVKTLCKVPHGAVNEVGGMQLVLASAIFGVQPTAAQVDAMAEMQAVDFVWSDARPDIYPLNFYIGRARLAGQEAKEYNTFGKDRDPRMAFTKAHAESIERQGMREPKNVTVARWGEVDDAIAPTSVVRYRASQYQAADFPYRPFDESANYHWINSTDICNGKPVQIIGDFIYGRAALKQWPVTSHVYTQANSSGCAAGPSLEFALQAALLEVIERDAYMRHWLSQTSGQRITSADLSTPIRRRVEQMEAAGCEVVVQLMNSVAADAVLVSATHQSRHFACVAGAARFELESAVDAALDELETSVYTRLIGMDFEPIAPKQVREPEAHTLMYAQKKYFMLAARVFAPTQNLQRGHRPSVTSLDSLITALAEQGLRPCYADLTPVRHCIDQGRTPLTVVKAVVPTLVPISFGFQREPQAMVATVHRGSLIPHPFP